jgi:geranylgeranyl diphosphate synthase type II
MKPSLRSAFDELVPAVDAALDGYLPAAGSPPGRLAEAMRYSVFAGGKRFRPALAILVCEALGGRRADIMPAACALEMIHTYSLIHDDLPAMDDDDFRRGKPSSHKAFGEATSILAGDALLTYAFEVAAGSPEGASPARLVVEIARGAGPAGMVAGQVADMEAEGKGGGRAEVEYIHLNKTAALIRASARAGAVAAGAPEAKVDAAGRYGEALGLLFQITDDILDVTGESSTLGKTAGKDAAAGKLTFAAVAGLEGARSEARAQADRALEFLEDFAPSHTILCELVSFVLERTS